MLDRKKMSIVLLPALNVALGAGFLSKLALAQGGSVEGGAQSEVTHSTAYLKTIANADSSVTVQSEHHLYRPG